MAKLDYFNRGIKGTSYSRRLTVHSCPRKYELSSKFDLGARTNSITFAFGHAVGAGIQYTLAGYSFNKTLIEVILAFDHDISDLGTVSEQRSKKSIWHAVEAAALFHKQYTAGVHTYLDGWVVPDFEHPTTGEMIPAVELTYVLDLVDGYTDEGHIDLVLYHPVKNRYMVVEIKTTGMRVVEEASYKYSDQALGYGIILDAIAASTGGTSSFDILYLVWKSVSKELIPMPFTKTVNDRARWLQQLLVDMTQIDSYVEQDFFPHRGESCFAYFRPCQFFAQCKMSNANLERLSNNVGDEGNDFAQMEAPMFRFTIQQLLARQEELLVEVREGTAVGIDSVDMLLDINVNL
jgi:hypothetical protein